MVRLKPLELLEGMNVTVHEPELRLQFVDPKDPPHPPSENLSTIPVGTVVFPLSVSVTVIVHVEVEPAATWLHDMDKVVERSDGVTWNAPWLPEWSTSPL
jgi:hypothetical protein